MKYKIGRIPRLLYALLTWKQEICKHSHIMEAQREAWEDAYNMLGSGHLWGKQRFRIWVGNEFSSFLIKISFYYFMIVICYSNANSLPPNSKMWGQQSNSPHWPKQNQESVVSILGAHFCDVYIWVPHVRWQVGQRKQLVPTNYTNASPDKGRNEKSYLNIYEWILINLGITDEGELRPRGSGKSISDKRSRMGNIWW